MGDSQAKQIGDQFTGRIGDMLDQGPPDPFRKTLYTGPSGTTRNAWTRGENFGRALNEGRGYTREMSGALSRTQGLGNEYGGLKNAYDPNSEAYQRIRRGVADDTLKEVGSQFVNSGRFGGGSYINTASEGLGDALAKLDYGNMQNDIDNQYRSIDSRRAVEADVFGMGQQGINNRWDAIGRMGQIGGSRDADAQARRLGDFDQWTRNAYGDIDWLGRINGAMGGNAAEGANEAPWWQQLLGFGIGAAGRGISGNMG